MGSKWLMAPCYPRGPPLLSRKSNLSKSLRIARILFWFSVVVTLMCLLTPAEVVLAAKVWVASWLPYSAALDAADFTSQSDKLIHACLFGLLGWLGARSWVQLRQRWGVVAGLLLLGVLTEVLQSMIPGRSASLGDWLADAFGVAAGLLSAPPAVVGNIISAHPRRQPRIGPKSPAFREP